MRTISPEPGVAVSAVPSALADRGMRGLLAGGIVLAVLVAALFWHFLAAQVSWAVRYQADWGHTLVIPFIAGYFVYLKRDRLQAIPPRTTWIALVPMSLGVAMYIFFWLGPPAFRHHNLQGAGMSLTLFSLVLLFFGFRAMSVLWFPLLYLCVFGQTISDGLLKYVTYPLQDVTAIGAWAVLKLTGADVDRTGNLLTVWSQGQSHQLNIAEACSGMRMLMAFLALGTAMAYVGFRRFWQQAALVALGVPIAILVNVMRVVTLSLLSLWDTNFAAGEFHTFIGLLWLVPAFLMYLGVSWVLRNLVTDDRRRAAP